MTTVTQNGTTLGAYFYNAMNERVLKSHDSMTARFVYDQASRLASEESGATRRDYVAVAGIPLAVADGASLDFITADGLGSPRAVTSSTGVVVWNWPYATNPFGENRPVSSAGYVLNLRLPGQYADGEAALKYNINRSFDAATGRYLQSDPIGLRGGISTYSYAGAGPLSWCDHSDLVVKVCRDPAFNGAFGSAIKHNWITTDTQSIGMGTPAAGSNTGNQYDPLGARVRRLIIVDARITVTVNARKLLALTKIG